MRVSLRHCMVLLLTWLLAGNAVQAREQLTIGITQFPSTLHPSIDSMLAKTYVLGMTRRPFTAYDHDWELTCMLCTELPSFENGGAVREPTPNGGEGLAVSYRIRPDARWGDGTPVTTADVAFAWQVGRHPDSRVTNRELFRRILDVEIHDTHHFTLHVDRITFDYASIGDLRPLPAHIERETFEYDPSSYHLHSSYVTEPDNPALYYGPYRISAVERGAQIILEPNPQWWGEPPGFRRIVIRTIANTAALEANLLAGDVDMIAGELGLPLDQALALEQRHGDDYRFLYQPSLIYEHMDVMLDNPILADRRVRRALLHGADREAISRQLFAGKQPVAHSSVNPLDSAYTEDIPHYPYDAARAAELLEAAGWDRIRQGIRHNATGEPLRLTLMTTAGNRSRELVQQVLQSQWRQLGIDVRIENQPPRVFFGDTVDRRAFDGLAMFAWVSAPENVPRSVLHSEEIPAEANNWQGQNYSGYRNPAMDRLLDTLETELDPDRRKTLWAELQRLYAEDLPALPLYFRSDAHVLPPWLEGLRPTGHMNPSSLWVEAWRALE
ncbi:MAG: peptide ABC transporter substrate-binding protein [Candidatus Competibacterales bacterium]|nr:peptide ABC transporter substrate-binding protein [Candidatus Competibacterales bacterium]